MQRKAERGSLQALHQAYATTLEGRSSHYDTVSVFRLHVAGPFPELAARPAAQIRAEELRDVLARLIEAAADRLPSLAQFSRARDRVLTLPELQAFWRRLKDAADSPSRYAVMACMYLGGRRPTQLLRVSAHQVDVTDKTTLLLDPKGRNRHASPRRHLLPIHDDLLPVIKRRLEFAPGNNSPLFSSTGRVPLRLETMASVVERIEATMKAEGEIERGAFSLRDLRRTAETHMAALGASSDIRAPIQSHGLGGIQIRHYDRHDYMPEKRAALQLWVQRFRGCE